MSSEPPSEAPAEGEGEAVEEEPSQDEDGPSSDPPEPLSRDEGAFWIAFALCSFVVVVMLWTVEYLPLIDLPQHAAQVAMWQRLGDLPLLRESLELNPFTPYLLAYSLARLFAVAMSVHSAFVLVVTLAAIATPLTLWLLVRQTGGNRWWALGGFALAFNYSYHWGFLNFMVGTPLAIGLFVLVLRYVDAPSPRRLGALMALLFFTLANHMLIFGLCGLVAAVMLLPSAPNLREAGKRAAVLMTPLPLVAWWIANTRATEAMTNRAIEWKLGGHRVAELFAFQLGVRATDLAPAVVGGVLLLFPLLTGGRPSKQRLRWAPLGVVLLLVVLGPHEAMGTAFVAGRYAAFVLPALIIALDRRETDEAPQGPSPLVAIAAVAVLGWLGKMCLGYWTYDRRTAGFSDVLRALEPGRRALYLAMYPNDPALNLPVYVHFGSYYAVERGGIVDFSFAQNFPALVRYRPEARPRLPHDFEWAPQQFVAAAHGGDRYDYILLRGPTDPTPWLATRTEGRVWLAANQGGWWAVGHEPAP